MKPDIKLLLGKGVAEVIVKEHLEKELAAGKKLRVKFGADPTSPDLHLGHAVALLKLKEFQNAGHKIVFIIGDYTARIGDPTGKSKARPALSREEIDKNAETYFAQVGKLLDVKKLEIHYNSEWFDREPDWAVRLTRLFTAQRILERDDFTKRLKDGVEVYLHELLYPVMQAYDSVKIEADVELGGTDQKFNMLAGRDLQRHMGLKEQDVITVPLLVGLDGAHKMSKSLGNYIGLTDEPNIMFGKIMAVPDTLIDSYYELLVGGRSATRDPRDSKLELGQIIVDVFHGSGAGRKAQDEFIRVFSNKEKPKDIPELTLDEAELPLTELLVKTGLAKSKSEARRLVLQGGVKIDDVKQNDPAAIISLAKPVIIQAGPRKFVKAKA
jgi:tyrosyl-tRNA synthetase